MKTPTRKLSTIYWYRVGDFERAVVFNAAYDFRNHPSGNYGFNGAAICFYLRSHEGAVHFVLWTDWQLQSTRRYGDLGAMVCHPTAVDLGYHSRVPLYNGQSNFGPCKVLDSADCYYDGTSYGAQPVFERLIAEGSDGVWDELESYYRKVFRRKEGV